MFLWLCLAATLANVQVVRVSDGDTITVQAADSVEPVRVRLAQIDAPEKKQPYGPEAKAALTALLSGHSVMVDYEKTDRYGRIIGQVTADGVDVNRTLVETGMAWVYRDYPHTVAYERAEEQARAAHVGLWSNPTPLPPWEFRRLK